MTNRTPQVGDTITAFERLDALDEGTVFLAGGHVWLWHGHGARIGSMRSLTGGAWTYASEALREYGGFTIIHIPGHPPRPEREVKAEALWEVAGSTEALERARVLIENELIEWRDSRRFTLRRNGLAIREKDGSGSEIIRFGFEYGYAMALRAEADRIARGDH